MENIEFNSTSFHQIDAKCRLFIPEGHRALLGEQFVMSLSTDLKTMAFYPLSVWEKRSARLRRAPETDRIAHDFQWLIFGNTFPNLTVDSQGRVLLPQAVRKNYGLVEGSEAVLVGAGTSLEVWSREKYDARLASFTLDVNNNILDYMNRKYFSDYAEDTNSMNSEVEMNEQH